MPRPMIRCPHCGRELYQLRYSHCTWCGMELAEEEFRKVALPPGEPPTPDLPPLHAENVWLQSSGSRGWRLLNQSSTSGAKLILSLIAIIVLIVREALVPIAYSLQKMWHVHHLLPLY